MEVIIQPDAHSASKLAARYIARLLRSKPNAVLGLATGSTPLMLYAELARLHSEEGLDFSRARSFNLDEYVGLGPNHPASYHHFMRENFFRHINMQPENCRIPDGTVMGEDIIRECEKYEQEIHAAGGIDLQILGIGSDGHIGFNEPSSSLASRTRIKTLTERTRQDNARFFQPGENVPHHVITMGIGTIMEAHEIFLFAFGAGKAAAVAGAAEGPITAENPASILQMHPRVKCFLDEEAASQLRRRDYYKWVYLHKPAWQHV